MLGLNNKGWGLGVFLVFIGVFFVAIILVTYVANKNGMGSGTNYYFENNNTLLKKYKEYETIIKERAIVYQEQNYSFIDDGDIFYVNINKLDVSDTIKSDCDGYAKIGKENGIYIYEPYLKCGNYTSNGYLNNLG